MKNLLLFILQDRESFTLKNYLMMKIILFESIKNYHSSTAVFGI